ncbi:MAG: hypothetical protein Q9220_004301 [cf. Caloplaca sp. 1 TL-2023]
MKEATGMTNLVACGVDHCAGAQAVCVKFATGFSFSYSGDCRPSKQFVRIGRNSTVLVHEATFDDKMQGDAEAKKHSTMSEAIGVASAMRAKRLVLTHFSQRYQKLPGLGALGYTDVELDDPKDINNRTETADEPAGLDMVEADQPLHSSPPVSPSDSPTLSPMNDDEPKIAIGFDFLRVRVGDIACLEKFTPTVQRLFELLEKEEKAKAANNPGEVARKLKEEAKQQKKDRFKQASQEKKDAKERNREAWKRRKGRETAGKSDRQEKSDEAMDAENEGLPRPSSSGSQRTMPDVRQLNSKASGEEVNV